MNQEHGPKDTKTYHAGANSDTNKELLGALGDGSYLDAENFRPSDTEGDESSAKQKKGEVVEHAQNPIPGAANFVDIGNIDVRGQKVEFWADSTGAEDPVIRVDGVIVAQSADLPLDIDHPLQLDKNESCVGGEVFITNNNTPPFILNVGDMVDNSNPLTTKYFAAFDITLYEVNLASALDIPVFIRLENVGGGGGLPVGTYQYALRYVTADGDRTNFSEFTPLIPVVQNLSTESNQYPGSRTYGDDANPESNTRYAPLIRFRVTNIFNYDFIEIIRLSNNSEQGINNTPNAFIVGRFDIDEGEISVRDFIDPTDGTDAEAVSFAEETRQVAFINKSKTIRYFDKRVVLMNVELESKESNLSFEEINGKKVFPVKEALGKQGYSDPHNFTYKKHLMGGEKYGWGVQLFDGVGGRGFVQKYEDAENFQMPNRRDATDADTELYSNSGVEDRKAANVDHAVSQTHEVFDLNNAIQKEDSDSFKNIYNATGLSAATLDGSKSLLKVNEDSTESTAQEVENNNAKVNTVGRVFPTYDPYRPTSNTDSDVSSHDYVPTVQVSEDGLASEDVVTGLELIGGTPYNPFGFRPDYYATGMMFSGLDNFPKFAKSFSLVRTDPANRVVAQGIGMYKLNASEQQYFTGIKTAGVTKDQDKLWFFSPDIENGFVSSSIVNDILDNPENYTLQFVSPLGFFSELYSFEESSVAASGDRLVDMISYARIARDPIGGSINPGDTGWGIGAGTDRFTAYSKWRNSELAGSGAFGSGNNEIAIESIKRVSEGRGSYIEIETTQSIYQNGGGGGDEDFDEAGLKDWHEPFYMVNIIQSGKNISDSNIKSYRSAGHYQKLESIIGEGNGLVDQEFELVDERWEDVIPALTSGHANAGDLRFLFVKDLNGVEEKYVNVTFKTAPEKAALLLVPGIDGLFTHTNDSNRFFTIVFDQGQNPPSGSQILIRYDKTAPIKVFGGDSIIGESLFAPIDASAGAEDDAADSQFSFDIAWPYRKMKLNNRHYVIKRTTGLDRIQDRSWATLGYIRQMIIAFTCESRIVTPYSHNLDYPLEHFPLTHYVMRPNRWKEVKEDGVDEPEESIYQANNIYEAYPDDYGVNESANWPFGGFRFRQNTNIDFSAKSPKNNFSKPAFGFDLEDLFCTGVFWSLPRAVNQQNSPGLRTFPGSNRFLISDDQGEIVKAYDDRSGKGDNLYAMTESGICLLLHKKSILSDLTGSELAITASDRFIQGQYWISKHVGMNDEMWRSAAEGLMSTKEGGSADIMLFANKDSVYSFVRGTLTEVGRLRYYNELRGPLSNIQPGFTDAVTGVVNEDNNEYWLEITNSTLSDLRKVYVFDIGNQRWIGKFTHQFDKYLSVDRSIYGMRDLTTFKLEEGNVINGNPIESFIVQVSAQEQSKEKEWIRIQVNSSKKPTRIELQDVDGNLLATMDQATQGQFYLKDYDGFEQLIPRKDVGVSPDRELIQDRALIYKIIFEDETDVYITSTNIQYKILK